MSGEKDLFGKAIRKRRPKYEAMLERHDLRSVPERAQRIRWLETVIPKSSAYMMPMESATVFQEAKECFIYGFFASTIVLSAAFAEHWLGATLLSRGINSISDKGLAAITDYCRENEILPSGVCDKVDKIRKIRNPFVHLKSFEHPYALAQRLMREKTNPSALLEADARDAIVTIFAVAAYAKYAK
ncbi:hypothetical protein SD235_00020 [Burkholderia cepacia]|uniref:hypothetical protein n=1 Tax=Burkholderia cepacia TaxID=292 RepID=UPI003A4DBD56